VERLIGGMDSQVSFIFPKEPPVRDIYLCLADSISDLPQRIKPASQNFGLLLLIDAHPLKSEEIRLAGAKLVDQGLAYLCAWGPDCERVHDIFDEASQIRNSQLSCDDVVMTTSHSDEPLIEALWFFLHGAFPTKCFETSCTDWVIATVGNPDWEQEIRNRIEEVAFLPPPD
jgi:hypothetical protein